MFSIILPLMSLMMTSKELKALLTGGSLSCTSMEPYCVQVAKGTRRRCHAPCPQGAHSQTRIGRALCPVAQSRLREEPGLAEVREGFLKKGPG